MSALNQIDHIIITNNFYGPDKNVLIIELHMAKTCKCLCYKSTGWKNFLYNYKAKTIILAIVEIFFSIKCIVNMQIFRTSLSLLSFYFIYIYIYILFTCGIARAKVLVIHLIRTGVCISRQFRRANFFNF